MRQDYDRVRDEVRGQPLLEMSPNCGAERARARPPRGIVRQLRQRRRRRRVDHVGQMESSAESKEDIDAAVGAVVAGPADFDGAAELASELPQTFGIDPR